MLNYSVVIPLGKLAGDVARCVRSACAQQVRPARVLVVCNGPVSQALGAQLLAQELALHGDVVQLVSGAACRNANDARNLGLELVTTEWVAFLDSDDWWEPGWAAAAERTLQAHDADFCYSSLRVWHSDTPADLLCEHWSAYRTPENYLLSYLPAQTSTYVVRTALARAVGWDPRLGRHQDYDFFVRAVRTSRFVATVPGVHVHVDWREPRRHRAHLDCLHVVRGWRAHVDRPYYRRHIRSLLESAIHSRDLRAMAPLGWEYAKTFMA